MAKLTGPLYCLEATGTFKDLVTYGRNQFGCWIRRIVQRKYTRTLGQGAQRDLFKAAIQAWNGLNEIKKYAWELQAYGTECWARDWFVRTYLKDKGPTWSLYPWVPPLPTESTIRIAWRYAWKEGGKINLRFWCPLVKDYPYESYSQELLDNYYAFYGAGVGGREWMRTWEAGFDVYQSDVKDPNDPSFEFLFSLKGGKYFYEFPQPSKQYIAVSVFDKHGKTMPLSWVDDWPGWS